MKTYNTLTKTQEIIQSEVGDALNMHPKYFTDECLIQLKGKNDHAPGLTIYALTYHMNSFIVGKYSNNRSKKEGVVRLKVKNFTLKNILKANPITLSKRIFNKIKEILR